MRVRSTGLRPWVAALIGLSLGVILAVAPVTAQETQERGDSVARWIEEGRLDEARAALEAAAQRFLDDSQVGQAAAVYIRLGAAFESHDRSEEALAFYRTALTYASYWNSRPLITEARFGMGRAYEALGDPDKALENYRLALAGEPDSEPAPEPGIIPVPVPNPAPLPCGGTNKVPVATADLPTGGLSGYGVGTNLQGAIVDLISSWLANTAKYPKCATKCPSGRAVNPALNECLPSIKVLNPSTTPGDYGVTDWKEQAVTGGVMIGPVTITKLPTGLEAEQSCSACK